MGVIFRPIKRTVVILNKGNNAKKKRDLFLTLPLVQKIYKTMSAGMPLVHAAQLNGVGKTELERWLGVGRKVCEQLDEGKIPSGDNSLEWMCVQLVHAVDQAVSNVCEKYTKRIDRQSKKNWNAAAWMLGKLVPEFAPQPHGVAVHATGGDKPQVSIYLPDNGRDPTPSP